MKKAAQNHIPAMFAILVGSLILFTCGCGSVPAPYIPKTVGHVSSGDIGDELSLIIKARDNQAAIGHPIIFEVTLRNDSETALWVPRNPNLTFHFVYANGKRDNYLEDEIEDRYFHPQEAVHLEPGQELETTFDVKTYYFDRSGITEFCAILETPENTNPQLDPFWSGRLSSNTYGVFVSPPKRSLKGMLLGQRTSNTPPT